MFIIESSERGRLGVDKTLETVQKKGLRQIWPVASLLLFASVLGHGLSATPLSRRMTRDTAESDE